MKEGGRRGGGDEGRRGALFFLHLSDDVLCMCKGLG